MDLNSKLKEFEKHVDDLIEEVRGLGMSFEDDLPTAIRWKLLTIGCSMHDYYIWVRKDDKSDGYIATEVETGMDYYGDTAEAAARSVFSGVVSAP